MAPPCDLEERAVMQAQIRSWVTKTWTWTFGGLPGWFVLPGLLPAWSTSIRVDSLPLHQDSLDRGDIVDVELGPALVLRKNLTVPLVGRTDLGRAIDLNMRQTLPCGGNDLLWTWAVDRRNGTDLHVNVHLLKKTDLDGIKSSVESQKAKLRTVRLASDVSAAPFWNDEKHTDGPRRFWGAMTAALCLLIAGFAFWQELSALDALDRRTADLGEEKARLSTTAVELKTKLDAEQTGFATIARDLRLFEAEFQRLPILLDLTEALKDDTWLSELSINGLNLRLSGFSEHDVTDVIDQLRGLAWADRVELEGPVSFDSISRRNRFELLIALAASPGGQP